MAAFHIAPGAGGRMNMELILRGDCPDSGTTLHVVATKMGLSPSRYSTHGGE